MSKTVLTFIAVLLVIGLVTFTAFFGLDIGAAYIPEVQNGITLGLDLVGGSEIIYEAEVPEDMPAEDLASGMETAQTMLRQRLNNLGFTEANVLLSGTKRIIVEIPNVEDPEDAVQMLGTTAVIEFRDCDGNVVLEGGDISLANAQYGQVSEGSLSSEYFVALKLTPDGYRKFVAATAEIAAKASGYNYLAIMMDDTVISSPYVESKFAGVGIDTDTPVITLGENSTVEYAKYLAEIISAGSLPFALRNVKLQAVGASLGAKSLESGIMAGIIGIALVMLFMLLVYRLPGLIADIALLLYIALFLVVMSAFRINLSLPGIAGIILTIGMAVDANVVIYERLREELRSGKTLRSAVDSGFKRAYTAIIDSNVTTIIAAAVLLWQGTGTILGFAKTLLIGVILSMLCMLIVPNLLLRGLAGMRYRTYRAFGVGGEAKKRSFSFVRRFKLFAAVSAVFCVIGLGGLILQMFGVNALNLDLDFLGGVSVEIELGVPVTREIQEDIEAIYADVAGVSANVTTAGYSGTAVAVKTVEISSQLRDEAYERVKEKYGEDKVALNSTDYVSASIGNDLKRSAFIASILAAALIMVYITIRFELKSGLAAVCCLIHDLLVMLSCFVIFRIPLNMTFIAAALTIIGYSINATIVVFDRVRENRKRLGLEFADVVDASIWQTMRRSIGTTVTTLLPVAFIIILGVTSIRVFAIPLMVGIIAGGYSSTCIAAPLWNRLRKAQTGGGGSQAAEV